MAKKKGPENRKINAKAEPAWRDRVVGFVKKPANEFLANPLNFRRHPNAQRDIFRGVIADLGFAGAVLENVRTGNLIDGHLRIEEALSVDETAPIPCIQVDLTEDEERLLLATYDPIGALAVEDAAAYELLLKQTAAEDEALQTFIDCQLMEAEILAGHELEHGFDDLESETTIKTVKVVIAVHNLRTVEEAITATGSNNRGDALATICEAYLKSGF